ncbi:MAG: hypothetical protein IPM57_05505 [Oligoflexia bacterium]|nr:hypothetical protein [Oligoflexia bacterium]
MGNFLKVLFLFFSAHVGYGQELSEQARCQEALINGPTLSHVAAYCFKGRIYGPGGTLEQLLELNKDIKDPNKFPKGFKININSEKLVAKNEETQKAISEVKEQQKVEVAKPAVVEPPPPPPKKVTQVEEVKESGPPTRYLQVDAISSLYLTSVPNSPFPPYGFGYSFTEQLGVRYLKWFDNYALLGILKAKVLSFTSSISSNSPISLEARYIKKWPLGVPGLVNKIFQNAHFTGVGGLEYYINSQETSYKQFADKYLMLKAGAGVQFDSFSKWGINSELLIGKGLLNTSYAVDWAFGVNYNFNQIWSALLTYQFKYYWVTGVNDAPDGVLPFGEIHSDVILSIRKNF